MCRLGCVLFMLLLFPPTQDSLSIALCLSQHMCFYRLLYVILSDVQKTSCPRLKLSECVMFHLVWHAVSFLSCVCVYMFLTCWCVLCVWCFLSDSSQLSLSFALFFAPTYVVVDDVFTCLRFFLCGSLLIFWFLTIFSNACAMFFPR